MMCGRGCSNCEQPKKRGDGPLRRRDCDRGMTARGNGDVQTGPWGARSNEEGAIKDETNRNKSNNKSQGAR